MQLFQTERTTIRQMTLADAPFILELVNSPSWLRFIGDRNIHDLDAAERHLESGFLKYYAEPGYSYYLVETKDEEPIGICGFLKKSYLNHEDLGFGSAGAADVPGSGKGRLFRWELEERPRSREPMDREG